MTYEFTGTVKTIKPIQTFASGFQKQEVVVTDDDPRFPNEVAFQFHKQKTALVATIREGDVVTVSFAIGGREWNGRHFIDLVAQQVYREGESTPAPAATAQQPPRQAQKPAEDPNDPTTWHNQQPADEQEELPF